LQYEEGQGAVFDGEEGGAVGGKGRHCFVGFACLLAPPFDFILFCAAAAANGFLLLLLLILLL